jgi:hypothetical protein
MKAMAHGGLLRGRMRLRTCKHLPSHRREGALVAGPSSACWRTRTKGNVALQHDVSCFRSSGTGHRLLASGFLRTLWQFGQFAPRRKMSKSERIFSEGSENVLACASTLILTQSRNGNRFQR